MTIPTTTSTMEIAHAASIVTLPLAHHDAVAVGWGASESASLFSTMHGPEETGMMSSVNRELIDARLTSFCCSEHLR